MTYIAIYNDNYLAHHGVKGMKWGVRRRSAVYMNSRGKVKSYKMSRSDRRYLNRKGLISWDTGDVSEGRENEAHDIVRRRKMKRARRAVTGLIAAGAVGYGAGKLITNKDKARKAMEYVRKTGHYAKETVRYTRKAGNYARKTGEQIAKAGRAAEPHVRSAVRKTERYVKGAARYGRKVVNKVANRK